MSRQAIELRIGSASLDTHSITPNLESILTLFSDSLLSISEIVRWPQASSGWLKMFFRIGFKSRRKTDQIIPPGPIQFKFLGY